MEQALAVNKLTELRLWDPRYARLYFGNEFCGSLIPSLAEFKEAAEFTRSKNTALTFVTSYCDDNGMSRYGQIIEYIAQECPGSEVVVNDWGMYKLCRGFRVKMALGRLLVKQKRDPRICGIIGAFPAEAGKRARDIGINKSLQAFLCRENIKRIELDNVSQGIDLSDINDDFLFSLHVPFVYITLSRYCKFNVSFPGEKFRFSRCVDKQCGSLEIFNKNMKKPLFMRGNTLFYKNSSLPEGIEHSRIDRIVYAAGMLNE